MAASITDMLTKVGNPGTVTSLQSPGKALAASSINIGSATNWPTDTAVYFAMRQVDSTLISSTNPSGLVPGTYTEWKGTVSGTIISNLMLVYGTDQIYTAGTSTQVFIVVSSGRENALVDWGLIHADQDGTLKANAVDNAAVLASNVVTTPKIADGAVTPNKLALGTQVAHVTASESTTSSTPADLTTTTDQVIVTVGANGIVLLGISSVLYNTGTNFSIVYFQASGANTIATSLEKCLRYKHANAANDIQMGTSFLLTGLTSGSTTFKLKYAASAGTSTFGDREIWALPL